MSRFFKKIIFLGFLVTLFTAQNSFSKTQKTLTIFAEPNLSYALTEIARQYSKNNDTIVSIEFGLAPDMIDRIEDGEESDLFISAHKTWIDNLKQKGLIDIYNINHITDDVLVLITSSKNNKIPESLKEDKLMLHDALAILNKNRFDLVVDHRSSSLGQHSRYIVDNNKFRSIRLFKKLPEDRTLATDLISKNPRVYSIMLNSQIHGNDKFQTIATLKNRKIYYQALVIAGDHMQEAREFSNFLKTKEAQNIFRKHGFVGNYVN